MSLDRRRFLRITAAGVAGGAISPALPLRSLFGTEPPGDFRTLRRNVGIFTERGGTMGWLANDEGIAVVDSQYPDTARNFLAGLPGRGGREVDVLLNSHHHGDHTAGNEVFRDETRRIVAHARARELHREVGGADAEGALADTTFQETWAMDVGDERVVAHHFGPAHTGGDSVIHFERADVVHMGDLVFNRAYPFIDRPGGASVRGWIELLEAVIAEHDRDTVFVFGHGRSGFGVTGDRRDLRVQADFLSALLEQAERAIRAGRSRDEVEEVSEIPGFPDHEALADWLSAGAALAAAWDELSEGG